jgi:hypothetical protein
MMPAEQVRLIQTGGIDWFGEPLKVDGIWGPRTEWWNDIRQLENPHRLEFLRLALGYHAVGAKEEPSIENGGTFVDMLLKPAGLRHLPWCVAFVSHCARKSGVPWPTYHVSAWGLMQYAKQNKLFVTDPIPGDIHVKLYPKQPGEQWKGHAGIYLGGDDDFFACVDGNVGNAVRVGRRALTHGICFVRLVPREFNDPEGPVLPPKLMRLDNVGDR